MFFFYADSPRKLFSCREYWILKPWIIAFLGSRTYMQKFLYIFWNQWSKLNNLVSSLLFFSQAVETLPSMLQSLHVKNSIWQATAVSSSSVTARDFVSHPNLAFWKPCSSVGVALALFEFSAWGMLVLLQWYLPTSELGEYNKDGPCQTLAPPLVFTEGWSVV